MNTDVAERPLSGQIIEDVIARGDLSKLTAEQRVVYYHKVCSDLGLNPTTVPFAWLTLQGKLVLYAKRDACDQLRKLNGIDIKVVDRVVNDGLLTVHVRATDRSGRSDEDFGVVSIVGLKGEAAANAMMKAVTKAKRRVTLSLSGLGFADESEVEGMIDHAQPFSNLSPSMSQDARATAIEQQEANREGAKREGERAAAERPLADIAKEQAQKAATAPTEIGIDHDTADVPAWSTWATLLLGYIRAAPDVDSINEWINMNSEHLAALQNLDTGKYRRLVDMINHQTAIRTEQGT